MLNILVVALTEDSEANISAHINKIYPNSNVSIIYKKDLADKPLLEKISCLRKTNYNAVIAFSDNLKYKRQIHFIKGLLLIPRASERKIVDENGIEIQTSIADFLFASIPALLLEMILGALSVLFCIVFFNLFLFYLKRRKKQPCYTKTGEHFSYIQATYAFTGAEGGDSTYRAGLSDGLTAWGQKIYFFPCTKSQLNGPHDPDFEIYAPELFNTLPDVPYLMFNFKYIWQAGRRFIKDKPMAILQHHDPFDISGPVLATLLNIPFFLDIHQISHWKLSFWYKIHLTYLAALAEEICLLRADKVLTISQQLKEALKGRVAPDKIVVKFNGVNIERFKPLNKGAEIRKKYGIEAEVIVGYAGTFSIIQGIDFLAKAIEPILKNAPNVHFLLMGEGDKSIFFKQFITEKGIEDRVTLTGFVPHNQIAAYLDACDVLIGLYTHADFFNSPVKIFEYMAMEKVVISTTQGQIPEIIDSGKNGLLIDLSKENSLVDTILLLAKDKNLRTDIGEKARQKVLENFTWDKTGLKVINAYKDVVGVNK